MPEARGDARTKMVEAAVVVLARSGYQGASFSAVLTESGAPRGSIYHHFPGGKDELVEAALELQTARVIAMLEAMHGIPPRQVAERFLEAWHRTLIGADFAAGCSLLAVATSAGPALQATAGRLFGDWMGALTRALTVGVPRRRGRRVRRRAAGGVRGRRRDLPGAAVDGRARRAAGPPRPGGGGAGRLTPAELS
ncbi:TetR/AcrR family transcriptional regulator [Tsukamurella soli]